MNFSILAEHLRTLLDLELAPTESATSKTTRLENSIRKVYRVYPPRGDSGRCGLPYRPVNDCAVVDTDVRSEGNASFGQHGL
jgi:hypothetical protein